MGLDARGERLVRRAEAAARRIGGRLGRRLTPALRQWRRIPIELRVGGAVAAFFVGSFFAAVVPLLTTGGHDPRAEVVARYPASLTVGTDYLLAMAVDNTSSALIAPLCLVATSDPTGTVVPITANFQGLETVPFVSGRACGGELSGQEVINVVVRLSPRRAGDVHVTLVAAQGSRSIGPVLSGTVHVASAG